MTNTESSIFHSAHILGMAAFLFLPLSFLAPKGIAALFVLTAVGILLLKIVRKENVRPDWTAGTGLLTAFAGWVVLSLFWSSDPVSILKSALVLVMALYGGWLIFREARNLGDFQRRFFETALLLGGGLGLLVAGVELMSDNAMVRMFKSISGNPIPSGEPLFHTLNRGAAAASLVVWPVAAILFRRYGAGYAIAGFAVFVLVVFSCQADSHKVALMLGVATFVGGWVFFRKTLAAMMIVISLGVIGAPWITQNLPDPQKQGSPTLALPNSTQHRIHIWRTTASHIFEKPLAGHGFNASRSLYGSSDKVKIHFGGGRDKGGWTNSFEPIPLHPHNGVLQVWLELGLLGAIMLGAGALLALWSMTRSSERHNAIVLAAFMTALFIYAVSFGTWQGWWIGALWLLGSFLAATESGENA